MKAFYLLSVSDVKIAKKQTKKYEYISKPAYISFFSLVVCIHWTSMNKKVPYNICMYVRVVRGCVKGTYQVS